MKKNYQPKPDKVQKLVKVYSEVKLNKVVKCDIFTKSVKLIAFIILLSGCSAQYHLKKALKKDSTIITTKLLKQVDTLIIRESFAITDTFYSKKIDTLTIEKNGVKTIVYRNHDIIKIKTIVKGDTIKVRQTIYKPMVKVKDCQHKWWIYVIILVTVLLASFIIKK
jgi:hypothetical protein